MLDEETPLTELMNITETGAEEAARHPRVVIEDAKLPYWEMLLSRHKK